MMASSNHDNAPSPRHRGIGGVAEVPDEPRETEEELRCGLGSCSPDCSQKCHNVASLTVTMCIVALLQGIIVNGFTASSVTMLEKRFGLSSTQIGVVVAMYDVGVVLLIIPVTYLGGKGHKGRWIAVCTVVFGIGSVVFSLPQFITDQYSYTKERDTLCEIGANNTDPCSMVDDSESAMFYVFLLAQLIIGFGCTTTFSLAFVYLDENSSTSNSALLTGIYYGISVAGAAVGYLLSGVFLDIYGDFYTVDDVPLDPDDPQWYGAWWIGFLIGAACLFIISVPLFSFARYLPGTEKHRAERSKGVVSRELSNTGVKDLCRCLGRLMCNPSYVFLILADSIDSFTIIGMAVFTPKYIEKVFRTTAGQAAIYTGLAIIPSGMLGAFLGGLLIKKLKLSTLWVIRFAAIVFFITLPFSTLFLVKCDQPPLVGVVELDKKSGLDSSLLANISACNQDCECWNKMYDPVCDPSEDFQFLSPCHAGCTVEPADDKFTDCACVTGYGLNSTLVLQSGDCEDGCQMVWLFVGLVFFMSLFTFMGSTPNIQGILRCVEPENRSLATGLGWTVTRIVGTIPGPIVIGAIIDGVCILWTEDCDKGKNCLVYDNDKFRTNLGILIFSFRLVSAFLMFLASVFYKPGTWEKEEETVALEIDDAAMKERGNTGHDNPAVELGQGCNRIVMSNGQNSN